MDLIVTDATGKPVASHASYTVSYTHLTLPTTSRV